MTGFCLLYSTFKNRGEAISAAEALLERRLVACANVQDGVTSLYRWEGEVRQEHEAVLVAKTTQEKLPVAIQAVKNLHSYELPCIIAFPIIEGFPPFLRWVAEETA